MNAAQRRYVCALRTLAKVRTLNVTVAVALR
jgi:hypothetical protein